MDYEENQKASGIKIGDRVRVLCKPQSWNGWSLNWIPNMDKTIGKVYTVCDIGDERRGIGLNNSFNPNDETSNPPRHRFCYWYYPYFVLEKLETEPKLIKKDIILNGTKLKVSEAIANLIEGEI